ncbi:MAG: hypothetical protein ACP5HU_08735 [Phycisphaerae bacterium]
MVTGNRFDDCQGPLDGPDAEDLLDLLARLGTYSFRNACIVENHVVQAKMSQPGRNEPFISVRIQNSGGWLCVQADWGGGWREDFIALQEKVPLASPAQPRLVDNHLIMVSQVHLPAEPAWSHALEVAVAAQYQVLQQLRDQGDRPKLGTTVSPQNTEDDRHSGERGSSAPTDSTGESSHWAYDGSDRSVRSGRRWRRRR